MHSNEMQRGYPWKKKFVKGSKHTLHAKAKGRRIQKSKLGVAHMAGFDHAC